MELVVRFSLALVLDTMVMDEKVKTGIELDTVSASCNYDAHYKNHTKYWCRGYFRDSCNIIAFTPNSTKRVALQDTGSQLIITMSCLVKEDTGWYWCGIQRDFARDVMDFTQLIVTDSRDSRASGFPPDPPGNRTRSCRTSKAIQKAKGFRMFILIICILITGLEIIFIISLLSRGRRSRRNRGGVTGKSIPRSPQPNQVPSVISIPLFGCIHTVKTQREKGFAYSLAEMTSNASPESKL